ncbi:SPOR domain-containing protein [Thioalkalicoccus limnaeus]|uniref:SPOR domain-containing protein n=1 Tax=Thioalkalicoccus limnaeus TaxID=120681 RepID=A0ABV4BB25_9GAMM
MTIDYRRGAPRSLTVKRREPRPCFFWFMFGGLIGAASVGLVWTAKTQPPGSEDGPPPQTAQTTPPSFHFWDILPEIEVVVPNEAMSAATPPPALPPRPQPLTVQETPTTPPTATQDPAPAPASPTAESYLLQVASFRRPADAERLRERLAALGIQTHIQTVTINNQDTYHRVRTGPVAGRDQANQIRDLLNRHGLESITIRAQ